MTLFKILTALTLLYLVFLLLAKVFKQICAVCLAIVTTWAALLAVYHLDQFDDQLLLGLLMGQSITGVYYFVFKRMPESWRLFQLPTLIGLIYLAYTAITLEFNALAVIFLAGVWAVVLLIFFTKDKPAMGRLAKSIIECCSKW